MKLRVCPAQKPQGCKDCSGRPFLTDRTGVKFPLLCKDRRYTELLNSVPLYIGDKNITGVDFVTLYFTFEDKKTVNNVICLFAEKMTYAAQHTNGLYYRDVL